MAANAQTSNIVPSNILPRNILPRNVPRRPKGPARLRVHRSWWVALTAVERYGSTPSGAFVVLRDGRRIPVGRTYRAWVQAALRKGKAR